MKMILPSSLQRRSSTQGGSAVLVVFILITLLVALAASNSRNLRYLKQELKLTEQRQLLKFQSTLVSPTTPELLPGWRTPPQARPQPPTNSPPSSQTNLITAPKPPPIPVHE